MDDGETFAARLRPAELRALTGRGRPVRYGDGELLMRQGDEGDHVVVLLSGLVKVLSHDEDGDVRLLGIREPGELLGEMACLDDRPRSVTVLAATELFGVKVARSRLLEYLDEFPHAALEVTRQVTRRLRAAERHRGDGADLRVLRALVEVARLYAGNTRTATVPLSQTEIAQLAGVSLVSAQRSLRRLRDRSLVTTHYHRLVVPCVACLRDAAAANPVTRRFPCPRCRGGWVTGNDREAGEAQ